MNDRSRAVDTLIVEPRHSGHLLEYVRVIADEVVDQGATYAIALGATVTRSPEFARSLGSHRAAIDEFETPLGLSGLRRLSQQFGARLTVVPHGDELLAEVALHGYRRAGRLVLLVMRDPRWETPATMPRRARNAVKLAFAMLASRRKNVDVVWLRALGYNGSGRHAIDPYIADGSQAEIRAESQEIRKRLSLSDGVFWLAVTGAITDRKNIPLVVDAISIAQHRSPARPIGLMLFGPIRTSAQYSAEWIHSELKRRGIPVAIDDRLISNFEMNAAVAAADAIVMAYSSHSPNSTMLKALAIGTRLVVAGPPSVQRFAKGMGFNRVTSLSAELVADSIVESMGDDEPPPKDLTASVPSFTRSLLMTQQ